MIIDKDTFKKAQKEYEHKLDNPFESEEDDDEQLFGEPDYAKQYIEDILSDGCI